MGGLIERTCTICKTAFRVKIGNGSYRCSKCQRKYLDNWRLTKSPEYWKNADLKTKFGITLEEYNEYLEIQGGVCAICEKEEKYKRYKYFVVDHDHKTGMVRGLLCHSCNLGIGKLEDNAELLRKAADYIDNDGVWL